jgi:hypothetical protein
MAQFSRRHYVRQPSRTACFSLPFRYDGDRESSGLTSARLSLTYKVFAPQCGRNGSGLPRLYDRATSSKNETK